MTNSSDSVRPPHACGKCDKPLTYDKTDAEGHDYFHCEACRWQHVSIDCCDRANADSVRHYNVGFDGDLRVTVRVEADAPESPADFTALAADWVRRALNEVALGQVPVRGIDDNYTFTVTITEATMNAAPELFEVNGDEVSGDDDFCRTCGEVYTGYGDGWDGECGNCADRSFARKDAAQNDRSGGRGQWTTPIRWQPESSL